MYKKCSIFVAPVFALKIYKNRLVWKNCGGGKYMK